MFDRIISLIGLNKFKELEKKKVLIIGCGGVGGYALETLVRSGISNIDIVEFDKIDITNLNRQIITNQQNIGLSKGQEAKKRAQSINKNININLYEIFLDESNIKNILSNNYDYIIDACDTINTKIEIIKFCVNKNIKLISCMGTAKKIDPTKLSITTLDKTNYDPLARLLRKKVKDLKINKKINVVSSTEQIIESYNLVSFIMVPATAGILCAKYIICDIINSQKEGFINENTCE